MKKIRDRVRVWVVNQLTRKLLKSMTVDDVLVISGKDWLFNKRKLSSEEIDQIKTEAKSFEDSLFWKLAERELTWSAQKTMFDNARVVDDLTFGKAMLYDFSLLKTFIKNIRVL